MEPDPTGGLPITQLGGVALAPAVCAYADVTLHDPAIVTLLAAQGIDVCRDWNNLRANGLERAEAAIYVSTSLTGPTWNDLLKLRARRGALALLILTAHTRANTRALTRIETDELLFLDEVSNNALAAAIAAVIYRTTARLGATALRENAFGLDSELAETLARACTSQRLVRNVNELARIMGYHRSELTRRWNKCTPADSHPHHFLEWLLLIHGLVLRSRTGKSWMHVAEVLGVKWHTLSETCQRLFSVKLGQLEHLERGRLLARLWEIVNGSHPDSAG